MEKSLITLILCTSLITLSACVTTSGQNVLKDQTETSLQQQIIVGKTTKADIQRIFGEPENIASDDGEGHSHWLYQYSAAKTKAQTYIPIAGALIGGGDYQTKVLQIYFDKRGTVAKYTLDQGKGQTRMGL